MGFFDWLLRKRPQPEPTPPVASPQYVTMAVPQADSGGPLMVTFSAAGRAFSVDIHTIAPPTGAPGLYPPEGGHDLPGSQQASMTEAEWLACADPQPMLEFLLGKASDRKLRLFAAACCRHIWDRLEGEGVRHAVEMAERFADGLASRRQLQAALTRALAGNAPPAGASAAAYAYQAARYVADWSAWSAAEGAARLARFAASPARRAARGGAGQADDQKGREGILVTRSERERERELARLSQAALLREVFGNPFRPPPGIEPAVLAWGGGTAVKLAEAIYDGRHFDGLPILADALEEARSTNAALLDHCRQPGEHVRGCWAVDLVLGKQ